MTDSARLRQIIAASGLKIGYIAEKIGLKSPTSFYNKLDNRSEFTVREVYLLCNLLGIKAKEQKEIFFSNNAHKT